MGGGLSTQDYGFRIYNPQLGKFLSVDPLTKDYPWYTPYQFAGNKPIWAIDLDGLEEFYRTDYFNAAGILYKTVVKMVDGSTTEDHVQIVHHSSVRPNPGGGTINAYLGTRIGTTEGSNAFNLAGGTAPTPATTARDNNIRMQALNIDPVGQPVMQPAADIVQVSTASTDGTVTTTPVNATSVSLQPGSSAKGSWIYKLYDNTGTEIGIRDRPATPNEPEIAGTGRTVIERSYTAQTFLVTGVTRPAPDPPTPHLHSTPAPAARIDLGGNVPAGESIGSAF